MIRELLGGPGCLQEGPGKERKKENDHFAEFLKGPLGAHGPLRGPSPI